MTTENNRDKNLASMLDQLRSLLQMRLDVIADHSFRDRDPAAHLAKLREVSESLDALHRELRPGLNSKLNHFLERASYQKALSFLNGEDA